MDAASSFLCRSIRIPSTAFTFTRPPVNYVCLVSDKREGVRVFPTRKVFCSGGSSATKRKPRRKSNVSDKLRPRKVEKRKDTESVSVSSETVVEQPKEKSKELSLRALNQNGDPLGRRDLGRNVVKWISQAMKAMASDFANAEVQGEFSELRQNVGSGLTFVIQAQPYLNAIPMPLGLEVICMKACTHYPTLFDHFQRELRDVLQDLESKNVMENWKETQSWKLLKEIANSGFLLFWLLFSWLLVNFFWVMWCCAAHHREVARKAHQPKPVAGVFGMDSEKVKAIQARIDEFTSRMSQLLQVERDTELEVTQEELDVIPTPDESSDSSKPIEFLVRHGEAPQELCDTICNLYAVSTSTG